MKVPSTQLHGCAILGHRSQHDHLLCVAARAMTLELSPTIIEASSCACRSPRASEHPALLVRRIRSSRAPSLLALSNVVATLRPLHSVSSTVLARERAGCFALVVGLDLPIA